MDTKTFWSIIDNAQGDTVHDVIEAVGQDLSKRPVGEIIDFSERLAEVLYALDRRELFEKEYTFLGDASGGENTGEDFLYARCAVVAAGSVVYEQVNQDPMQFAREWNWHAQDLLYVPEEAYEELTDETWEHETETDYETGSNSSAWS
ncbi:DUF4240 domain-containing protein [Streptomyces stackebrandtii]|uniref:DUF4240 domain-containing protein n=1 Tax=Streptomyces stackebrandtii TaxID=3051177 RepID=UPI0028DB8134|nr:DUF4240 domain-containing protein [Streptomyces sp. DSM 40976]